MAMTHIRRLFQSTQVHLTLALEMPKDVKVLNVPVLGTIARVLGSFAGVIGKTKDAEMR